MENKKVIDNFLNDVSSKYNRSKNQCSYLLFDVFCGNILEYLEYEEFVKQYYFGFKVCFTNKFDYLLEKSKLEIFKLIDEKNN